jgi:nucleoside-diphosphate kinase
MTQRTLVLLKPDTVRRGLVGAVLARFESRGLTIVAMVVEGQRCIEGFRSLAGATDPTVAAPGTIRGDLGRDWGLAVQQNLVHGSDSPESAEREIAIWYACPAGESPGHPGVSARMCAAPLLTC